MIGEPQSRLDGVPHALGKFDRPIRCGVGEQDDNGVFGVAGDPVMLAKVRPQ